MAKPVLYIAREREFHVAACYDGIQKCFCNFLEAIDENFRPRWCTMRHYRVGSVGGGSSNHEGLDYSKPLIFVMKESNETFTPYMAASWCRTNKFKVIAIFMVLLLAVQYLFGASIYNIRIFDYNIAQIYIWNDASKVGDQPNEGAEPVQIETVKNVSANIANGLPAANTSAALKTTYSSSFTDNATKSVNTTTIRETVTSSTETAVSTTSLAVVTLANGSLPLCPLLPPVLGKLGLTGIRGRL